MSPEVSWDFSESVRSPQRVRPLADKIDMQSSYFMEETCGQGGSTAPLRAVGSSESEARGMLIQLGFADTLNIEVRAGLALGTAQSTSRATFARPGSPATKM